MANWVSATDTEENDSGYVNLDTIQWVTVTGGGSSWNVTAVNPSGGANYKLAGSPFDSEADAIAAFLVAAAPSASASFSGTVTYPG